MVPPSTRFAQSSTLDAPARSNTRQSQRNRHSIYRMGGHSHLTGRRTALLRGLRALHAVNADLQPHACLWHPAIWPRHRRLQPMRRQPPVNCMTAVLQRPACGSRPSQLYVSWLQPSVEGTRRARRFVPFLPTRTVGTAAHQPPAVQRPRVQHGPAESTERNTTCIIVHVALAELLSRECPD